MAQGFEPAFCDELVRLMRLRRDVRRFRSDPVPASALERGFKAFALAPSVGLSEPWRVLNIESAAARAAALLNYQEANAQALAGYSGERAEIYAGLKLSGMREAPVQLAVFCDETTPKGAGLGAGTMPEMRAYSVVAAITSMWFALRAEGLGLGWVSILDPERLKTDLNAPESWRLVAYLCIGYPEAETEEPELVTLGWEPRLGLPDIEVR